jgi:hypothetical protein
MGNHGTAAAKDQAQDAQVQVILKRQMAEATIAQLLSRVVAADLAFVLIGGLAARAWGVAGHRKDVDIVVDPRPTHLARVAQLVMDLEGDIECGGMCARSPALIAAVLSSSPRVLANTELGPLDIVNRVEGVPPYSSLRRDAASRRVYGVTVPVCSLAHLHVMKQIADRDADRQDLEHLKRVLLYPSYDPARPGASGPI